tara:strand:- start:177 stop:362 length:186 start_codon:yes stop_codon:yes gene_type:complete
LFCEEEEMTSSSSYSFLECFLKLLFSSSFSPKRLFLNKKNNEGEKNKKYKQIMHLKKSSTF